VILSLGLFQPWMETKKGQTLEYIKRQVAATISFPTSFDQIIESGHAEAIRS
jgi:hypothetical protein